MMKIEGVISTPHAKAGYIAGALRVDNLSQMTTRAGDLSVETTIESCQLRSVIASVDDYLMNLAIAEDVCHYVLD